MVSIGCGNMAGAMLARWLEVGMPPDRVEVVRPSGAPVADGVRVVRDHAELLDGRSTDVILIGTKPQLWDEVRDAVRALATPDSLILSIMSGVRLDRLRQELPEGSVVRLMPNLPVRYGAGVVARLGDGRDQQALLLSRLLSPLGHVETVNDESVFEAVTALAGCGPAFVYRFVDALADAGADLGLAPDRAAALARATLIGAAAQLGADSQVSPAELADRVASPGGSTRAGLDRLDADASLSRLIAETLRAARDRSRALG